MILLEDEKGTEEIRHGWYQVVNDGLRAILFLSDQDVKQYRDLGYHVKVMQKKEWTTPMLIKIGEVSRES